MEKQVIAAKWACPILLLLVLPCGSCRKSTRPTTRPAGRASGAAPAATKPLNSTSDDLIYEQVPVGDGFPGYRNVARQAPLPRIGKQLSTVSGVSITRVELASEAATRMSSNTEGAISWYGADYSRVKAKTVTLLGLLVRLSPDPDLRTLDDAPLPGDFYEVEISGEDREDLWWQLVSSLEKDFAIEAFDSAFEQETWVLRKSGSPLNLIRSASASKYGSIQSAGASLEFRNTSMAELAKELEYRLGWIVLDETTLDQRYDFSMIADLDDGQSWIRGLGRVGLEVVELQRTVDFIHFEKAKKPSP